MHVHTCMCTDQLTLLAGVLAQILDPLFQLEVFPLLKPLSVAPTEFIFHKVQTTSFPSALTPLPAFSHLRCPSLIFHQGDVSHDLHFLIKGAVEVRRSLSQRATLKRSPSQTPRRCPRGAPPTPRRRGAVLLLLLLVTPPPPPPQVLSGIDERVLYTIEEGDYFGESVLTGRRRSSSHRASAAGLCELYAISGEALEALFSRRPREGRIIYQNVMRELRRKELMRSLALRLMIGAYRDGRRYNDRKAIAALRLQLGWFNLCTRLVYQNAVRLRSRTRTRRQRAVPRGLPRALCAHG